MYGMGLRKATIRDKPIGQSILRKTPPTEWYPTEAKVRLNKDLEPQAQVYEHSNRHEWPNRLEKTPETYKWHRSKTAGGRTEAVNRDYMGQPKACKETTWGIHDPRDGDGEQHHWILWKTETPYKNDLGKSIPQIRPLTPEHKQSRQINTPKLTTRKSSPSKKEPVKKPLTLNGMKIRDIEFSGDNYDVSDVEPEKSGYTPVTPSSVQDEPQYKQYRHIHGEPKYEQCHHTQHTTINRNRASNPTLTYEPNLRAWLNTVKDEDKAMVYNYLKRLNNGQSVSPATRPFARRPCSASPPVDLSYRAPRLPRAKSAVPQAQPSPDPVTYSAWAKHFANYSPSMKIPTHGTMNYYDFQQKPHSAQPYTHGNSFFEDAQLEPGTEFTISPDWVSEPVKGASPAYTYRPRNSDYRSHMP